MVRVLFIGLGAKDKYPGWVRHNIVIWPDCSELEFLPGLSECYTVVSVLSSCAY